MKVVTVEEMRRIEECAAADGIGPAILMESAGRGCASEIMRRVTVRRPRIVVLAGPGNNGGDGLVTAHYLLGAGALVDVICTNKRPDTDPNLHRVGDDGIIVDEPDPELDQEYVEAVLSSADAVVDALLGTGRSRPLEGAIAQLTTKLNDEKRARPGLLVVAVDLPTGLDADTGAFDPRAVRADVTLALGFPKVGHFTYPGASAVGELCVLDIGLAKNTSLEVTTELITPNADGFVFLPPARPRDGHKGTFGRLLIIGGCAQYYGAPVLAAAAALRSGVGLAQLAVPASIVPILAGKLTEATFLPLAEDPSGYFGLDAVPTLLDACARADAVVLGCGIGLNSTTKDAVRRLVREMPRDVPLLVDADALTILAEIPEWWSQRPENVILTPHAGEMGRLIGADAAAVQSNRLRVAREAALRWGVTVVLKGAGTIVAAPDGTACISAVATPALATAGTGDCLAGTIGALMAQGVTLDNAATLGVYLHGEAGLLAEREIGLSGTLAGDIIERLPRVIQSLRLAASH